MSSEPEFEIRDLDVADAASDGPLLEVRDLRVEFATAGGSVRAVDGVDMEVREGEFVGVVGESGCGKSTLLFAIARLLSPPAALTGGRVVFRGQNLVTMTEKERGRALARLLRRHAERDERIKPGDHDRGAVQGHIDAHAKWSVAQTAQRCVEVMKLVGIDPIHLKSYPHQLSGGMRQRAMIAMALLFTPDLVIMDEPTSALDVVAQRSLMVQIKELQQKLGFAVIFVTHDMSLVSHFSDQLLVMYAGLVVEVGPTRAVFDTRRIRTAVGCSTHSRPSAGRASS
jgi:peptide/nickel transport system ATP-binding protein